jgi:hypothetical protein
MYTIYKNILFMIMAVAILTTSITSCDITDDPIIDKALPAVTSTTPVNLDSSVTINSAITVIFSEDMDPLTFTAENFTTKTGDSIVSGAITYTDTSVSFTPNNNFEYSTTYTTTVTAEVKDLKGNSIASNYTWSYTTVALDSNDPIVDIILPTVVSSTPVILDSIVAINSVITATFSEAMDPLSLTAVTFVTKDGDSIVSGAITYTDTSVSFTPNNNFEYSTTYTTTVTTGVKDLSGNQLASDYSWSYTTVSIGDTAAPTAIAVQPLDSSVGVNINSQIRVTFNEAMKISTINSTNFLVANGTTPVPGNVTYDIPNKTAVFSPSENLESEILYTVTLTTGVTDLNDNSLAVNKVWNFTTAASGSGPDPVMLGTAGNFVILAKTAVSTVPASIIIGDIGISPAAETYITGFSQVDAIGYATSPQVTGFMYAADMAAPIPAQMTTAISDMETAYTDAAGRINPDSTNLSSGNIGGLTLAPGLYTWGSSVTIPTDITLSGGASDVWIFQVEGDLSISADVKIILSGEAKSQNIFWQVSGEAILGATSHFEGIILSKTAIRMGTGATLKGRALAQTQVALDQSTVTKP